MAALQIVLWLQLKIHEENKKRTAPSKPETSQDALPAAGFQTLCHTVKPVLSGHSKIYKLKVLMTGGCLMQV